MIRDGSAIIVSCSILRLRWRWMRTGTSKVADILTFYRSALSLACARGVSNCAAAGCSCCSRIQACMCDPLVARTTCFRFNHPIDAVMFSLLIPQLPQHQYPERKQSLINTQIGIVIVIVLLTPVRALSTHPEMDTIPLGSRANLPKPPCAKQGPGNGQASI